MAVVEVVVSTNLPLAKNADGVFRVGQTRV